MQNEIPFAQTMNFKKCVKERYDSIGPFSCCHGFINDVLICLGIPSHHTPNKPALRAVNLNANITLKWRICLQDNKIKNTRSTRNTFVEFVSCFHALNCEPSVELQNPTRWIQEINALKFWIQPVENLSSTRWFSIFHSLKIFSPCVEFKFYTRRPSIVLSQRVELEDVPSPSDGHKSSLNESQC